MKENKKKENRNLSAICLIYGAMNHNIFHFNRKIQFEEDKLENFFQKIRKEYIFYEICRDGNKCYRFK